MIFLVAAPLLKRTAADGGEDPIHIEHSCGDLAAPLTTVVMKCGVSCVIDDEGRVTPDEVDWVFLETPNEATCAPCRAAAGLPPR